MPPPSEQESALPLEPAADRRAADRAALAIAPGVLFAGVAGGIAFPILPVVGQQAGLPLWLIGAILSANRVGRVVCAPVVGTLSDRLGGRRLLLGGLLLQLAVMALFVLGVTRGNPGLYFLLGRVLHGPASAGVFVAGQALALHAGGRRHAGVAAGTVRAAMSLGVPVGIVVGGVLSARVGNAATFESGMLALLAAAVLAALLVPDVRAPVAARVPLKEALRALSDRRMLLVGLLNIASSFVAQGLVLTTLVLVVTARALSLGSLGPQVTASVLLGAMVVVSAAATLLFARLARSRVQHARVALLGVVLLALSLLAIALVPGLGGMAGGVLLLGIGGGALSSALLALVGELVDPAHRGAAVGWFQLCSDIGGALGPLAGASLLGLGTRTPYLLGAVLVAAAVPVALRLVRSVEGEGATPDSATRASC